MEFREFRSAIQTHFAEITADATHLFEVAVDKDAMWNTYLDSFPAGTNEIYRQRREYDCSCCRHFIKNIGNAVVIKDGQTVTIWDLELNDDKFQIVANAMSAYIKSCAVDNVYISKFATIGTEYNFERGEDGSVKQWEHFQLVLPKKFVDKTSRSVGDLQGGYRDTRNVFKRSLDEISESSVLTVLELIAQNSLYKGEEWKNVLQAFVEYKRAYDALSAEAKELFAWEKSIKAGAVVGRIRNHSIGTLLVNISEGMELDEAVRKYEQIVAPENYKRSKPIFTQRMLEEAQKTITELGYMDSLARRYATLDDITVNNILFSNKDAAKRIVGAAGIFDSLARDVSVSPKKFSKVEEISIEEFLQRVLPTATDIEVFLEGKHQGNFVSLIAPANSECKSMFKWNNGFSWAYKGNITDSTMRENVKAAGGDVNGVLRFSIQWNDGTSDNYNDFDAHCTEPNRNEIYFSNKGRRHASSGMLDVDIINPTSGKAAVENITWSDKNRMPKGVYSLFVHCYSDRGGRDGFSAEVEFDGQIYSFAYHKPVRQGEIVRVAEVTYDGVNFSIKECLPASASGREVWGLTTNQFIPVSVICYSPNYWDEQNGIGHRHYFFMLKGCVNEDKPNGMFNEYLKEELMKHRKVFEALGSRTAVENSTDQLSGLGFSSTRRNDLVVKVKGSTERILKIKF